MKNKAFRGFIIFALLIGMTMALAAIWGTGANGKKETIDQTTFYQLVEDGKISRVLAQETQVFGLYKDTKVAEKGFPKDYDFAFKKAESTEIDQQIDKIIAKKLNISPEDVTWADYGFIYDTESDPGESWLAAILPTLIMVVIVGGLFFLFMRQVQGTNNKAISFGKSRARMVDANKKKVTFQDVAGAEEEKDELKEIVEFLKNPKKFVQMGARIPKGVLLVGPPGTGKTLLARAVAGEAGVPFMTISGSDFVEMYVGVGASRVRDLFEQAKKNAPSIVFIDEIDAVGRHRGSGLGGGHDEREQTLNQLLVEMDGFSVNEGIIIIAATNRPDILDPALLRPGRFDRRITVSYPDVKGREDILKVHAKGKPLGDDIDLTALARLTPMFTGADLENVLNEAAILAARNDKDKINMREIREAIDRVQMGPEKKSRKVTERDKKLVAYHEAGHALVANAMKECDPVHVVSIIPRGMAGGYTQTLPNEDDHYVTKAKLRDRIAMAMGGYVAEHLVMGDVTTGSSSDLKGATEIARRMITEFGMSDDMGPVYLAGERELMIGKEIGHTRNYSEKLSAQIDNEISRIVDTARKRAEDTIKANMEALHRVVGVLLEKEKIDGDEFRRIVNEEQEPINSVDPIPQPI